MDHNLVLTTFDLLWTHPKIGVHVLDDEGWVLYCNDAAARLLLDLVPGDVMGRRVDDFLSDQLLAESR